MFRYDSKRCGGTFVSGTALQAGRSRVRFPIVSLNIFIDFNTFGRIIALEPTQPMTEMTTGVSSVGVKAVDVYDPQPRHLPAPISWKLWKPNLLRACPALCRNSLI
jgi:hypothetical protein